MNGLDLLGLNFLRYEISINIIALLNSLDLPTDDHLNPVADPEWCKEGRPDCSTSYTKQHCKMLCKSDKGNYV